MRALILVLFAATASWAEEPCRRTNKSGLVPTARMERIAKELLSHSGIDEPSAMRQENRQATVIKLVLAGRLVEGSPALAKAAHIGAGAEPFHQVILTYGLLEAAQSEAEAAFFTAHEIAHLAGRHSATLLEKIKGWVVDWLAAHPEAPQTTQAEIRAAVQRALADPALKARITGLQKAHEREADQDGLTLMGLSGYSREEAHAAMQSLRQWLACLGYPPDLEEPTHDTLIKRIQTLRLKAAQFEAREKKLQQGEKPPSFE